jgi:hypothetical protein
MHKSIRRCRLRSLVVTDACDYSARTRTCTCIVHATSISGQGAEAPPCARGNESRGSPRLPRAEAQKRAGVDGFCAVAEVRRVPSAQNYSFAGRKQGDDRNRTGVDGFAARGI